MIATIATTVTTAAGIAIAAGAITTVAAGTESPGESGEEGGSSDPPFFVACDEWKARRDFGHWGVPRVTSSLVRMVAARTPLHSVPPPRHVPEAAVVRIGRALAHPLRVRVLQLMVDGAPYRAGVLARRFHVALPLMKQHLVRLQSAQLIQTERIDNAVYYRIAGPESVDSVRPLLAMARAG